MTIKAGNAAVIEIENRVKILIILNNLLVIGSVPGDGAWVWTRWLVQGDLKG